jgi:mannose-6-phosphate isomerase-like protein (cupin superfamily)
LRFAGSLPAVAGAPWHRGGVIRRSAGVGGKGWLTGPWDCAVPVALGFADCGVDDLHHHEEMYEIYLVARGQSTAVVDGEAVPLQADDLLVVEPGEEHTFVASSEDYLHFVVQAPFVVGDKRSS